MKRILELTVKDIDMGVYEGVKLSETKMTSIYFKGHIREMWNQFDEHWYVVDDKKYPIKR
jgi:hypothetical protein